MAGRKAVGAAGYFDVQVEVEGPFVEPPQSCFLDGLQVGTGATLGKRNLTWKKADAVVVRVKNTKTGAAAELRPTTTLSTLLNPPKSEESSANGDRSEKTAEEVARRIARMPVHDIFLVKVLTGGKQNSREKESPIDPDAEKAKAALLQLIRDNPGLFIGEPDPEHLEKLSLVKFENEEYLLGAFHIDLENKGYSAMIGVGDDAGEVYYYHGKFQVDEQGRWTAVKPEVARLHSLPK
jgi:hypothetical protein